MNRSQDHDPTACRGASVPLQRLPFRQGSQTHTILRALMRGDMSGAQIAELIDDITPFVARTMAKMRERGLTFNRRAGLGGPAVYAISDAGRAALAKAVGHG